MHGIVSTYIQNKAFFYLRTRAYKKLFLIIYELVICFFKANYILNYDYHACFKMKIKILSTRETAAAKKKPI